MVKGDSLKHNLPRLIVVKAIGLVPSQVRILPSALKTVLETIIEKSGLAFLDKIEFEQVTAGRYFQKSKTDLGNGCKMFFVVLAPSVESPIHNHAGQNMEETHLLLYGSGKFILYGDKNRPLKKVVLEEGKFHKPFSTKSATPDHQYVAGPRGSITLAVESYF